MQDKTASEQIDGIITMHPNWKGDILSKVRAVIRRTEPVIVEEIKWKMRTRPEGLAVWSKDGIVCFMEIWKDNVKLLFPNGAHLKDDHKLFNARLEGKDIRAVEFRESDAVPEAALSDLIREAIQYNSSKK